MKNTALILIDIQKDYFQGGAKELQQPEAATKQAALLLEAFREAELPLFHIQHAMPPERGLSFLIEGTKGAEIHPLVAPKEGEAIVVKTYPNSFFNTDLHEQLQAKGITNLIICGMMTQMCVSTTARAAMELGYTSTIASDATASLALELEGELVPAEIVYRGNLAALNGSVSRVSKTDTVLSELTAMV